MTTATFSEFLRHPNEVTSLLDDGPVLLTRRDAEPLILSRARTAERSADALSVLSALITSSLNTVSLSQLVLVAPWLEFLPAHVREEFMDDFVRTARACSSIGNFDRLGGALEAWKGTAEAYAAGLDPSGDDLDYIDGDAVPDPRGTA